MFCCLDIIPVERLGSLAFCKMFLEQVVENLKAISPATLIFKLYNPCLPTVPTQHKTSKQRGLFRQQCKTDYVQMQKLPTLPNKL